MVVDHLDLMLLPLPHGTSVSNFAYDKTDSKKYFNPEIA
jgi:hypothetical protein